MLTTPTTAQAGEIYGKDSTTNRKVIVENVEAGRVVVNINSGVKMRKPTLNILTITFSADLVTSNKINLYATNEDGTLTAISEVTFDTNHVTTMGLIGDAIVAVNPDISYTVGGGSNRVLTLRTEGSYLFVANVLVTAGASQATATLAQSSDDTVAGISVKKDFEKDANGNVYCPSGNQMTYITKGKTFVYCKGAFNPNSTAYARVTDGTGDELRGTLRLDNTNAVDVSSIKFISAGTDEMALVEINLP